jgi:hypothetical protein
MGHAWTFISYYDMVCSAVGHVAVCIRVRGPHGLYINMVALSIFDLLMSWAPKVLCGYDTYVPLDSCPLFIFDSCINLFFHSHADMDVFTSGRHKMSVFPTEL